MANMNIFPRNIVFRNIRNMTIQNMANVNTLIRKGYLLAGVIMAANMFVVNEVRAMDNEYQTYNNSTKKDKNKESFFIRVPHEILNFIVFRWENASNLIGGLALSGANNYFKWWKYDQGKYWKLGCYGWRTKRFFNDYLQFDININLGRGILRLIPGTVLSLYPMRGKESLNCYPLTAFLIAHEIRQHREIKNYDKKTWASLFFILVLQSFISAPLTVHISNLSISISLDSIFWMLIDFGCVTQEKRRGKKIIKREDPFNPNIKNNKKDTN